MAHQEPDRSTINQAASEAATAAAAQAPAAPEAEVTLAYGAHGEKVTQLVDLLALLGHATNNVIKGGPPVLDETVLADVRAALEEIGIGPSPDEAMLLPAEIPVGVLGELVDGTVWDELYTAAAAKLPPPETSADGTQTA